MRERERGEGDVTYEGVVGEGEREREKYLYLTPTLADKISKIRGILNFFLK